ncbi:MAG: hypothetical protein JWO19_4408 [Bryobacterales bacterium]|nr:hypothetical protein [Bryobacterales bacterium]
MMVDFDNPYVIDAAGFWLKRLAPEAQRCSPRAISVRRERRRREKFFEKVQSCLSVAASSSCTTPTGTR